MTILLVFTVEAVSVPSSCSSVCSGGVCHRQLPQRQTDGGSQWTCQTADREGAQRCFAADLCKQTGTGLARCQKYTFCIRSDDCHVVCCAGRSWCRVRRGDDRAAEPTQAVLREELAHPGLRRPQRDGSPRGPGLAVQTAGGRWCPRRGLNNKLYTKLTLHWLTETKPPTQRISSVVLWPRLSFKPSTSLLCAPTQENKAVNTL